MTILNPLAMPGRLFLVTGASSGIGRETAIVLSGLGARVVLVARNQERLEETRSRLQGDGHILEPRDLSEYEQIPDWLQQLAARHGPLDGVVHGAGQHLMAPLRVLEPASVERVWRINVLAALWLAKGYRQRTVGKPGGSILFISSVAGLAGQPAVAGYAASKGALIALTRSLATELAREKIRVNCIAPGLVASEMTTTLQQQLTPEAFQAITNEHLLGLGEAADVAFAAAYLLSAAAKWITGSVLVVDGGYTAH